MLQAVTKDVPSHDLKSVVGDLSAKVGADRQYCPEVLGCHSIGEMNETSVLLVDYVLSNDLTVKRKIKSKLPYIKTFENTLLDARDFQGADVNSDHILVVAEM
ncbi:hypothetical protein QYM36_016456 [Artemia franciscana]|uniref:Uncharacterized protein n=1 Tax=Artemia franciscana TaxID=6661 RepID=A0AA88HCA1_ARTSF|nr:hypothetical protein QYM36_016456 [Artemia franciscana]